MKLAQRTTLIAPSETLEITAKAKAMRAAGINVLALSAGEPDFDTPNNIKEAAASAIRRGDTKYTPVPGTPALREAVAKRFTQTSGIKTQTDQVIVSTGGKQVLYNACASLLDPGDEALILSPYWVSYPDMVRLAGANPIFVKTQEAQGFAPEPDVIAKAISAKTRMVILNSPSNPAGATYSRAHVQAIADILRKRPDITVVSDDIYEALVYDQSFVNILHVAPDLADRTLVVSGVSKSYAMTGWRIGFGIGPKELIDAMNRLQGAATSGACSIAQAAALEAVVGDQTQVKSMAKAFKERRNTIVQLIKAIPDVTMVSPGGAFYAFPNVSAYYGKSVQDSRGMINYLLETQHLAVVPGSAFGADEHVRLSFAASDEDIAEGVRRLQAGLLALRGG